MSETINIVIIDKKFETQALQGLVIRSEGNANTIKIQFPKTYESEDLTTKMFILKCTNANGIYFETLLQKNVKTDYIELTWIVEPVFTTVSGILKVAIFAESANYSLGTQMSKVIVEESPQIMVPIDQYTVFEQYLKEMRVAADSTESYYEQTLAIKNDFESKIVDNLASTDPQKILSANQGRVLNTRIDNIVGQTGTSNTEIVDARYSAERNVTYPTLKSRLDAVDGDIVKSKYSAPTTATAPIISLPNTAVKGKIEGSLKGNTLYQAVTNGDFSNGTTGWSGDNVSTISVAQKKIIVTGTGTSSTARVYEITSIPAIPNSRVFVKTSQMVTNSLCNSLNLTLRGSTGGAFVSHQLNAPLINTKYERYIVFTVPSDATGFIRIDIIHNYLDATTANGKVMEVDGNVGVFAIPISGTPYENWTAEQLNAVPMSYWEGLGNSKPVKAKVIGKNLWNGEFLPNTTISSNPGAEGDFGTNLNSRTTKKIKCKPNTIYRVFGGNRQGWRFEDKNGNKITFPINSAISVTSPANAYYMYVYYSLDGTHENVMLSEGSTALPYEPYQETELFCPVELGSVPNGVQDEFTFDGKFIQRTKEHTLQSGDITTVYTGWSEVDSVLINKPLDYIAYGNVRALLGSMLMGSYRQFSGSANSLENINKFRLDGNNVLFEFVVPKGTYANLTAAQTALAGTKIRYQLAKPIEMQYPVSNLIAEPSGTIYVSNEVTLTKQYKTGISVTNKIKSLNSVFMVNNNIKIPINLSLVSVASDGMFLTILNANAANFYEINYETFGVTLPTIEYSYPSNLAGAVLANTESIKEIDLTLESFIALQNAMNVEFDFRLTTGGH